MPAKGTSPRERWNPLLKSYPDSEKINAVSFGAETMFTRLVAKADDYGNYWASPKMLLSGLFSLRWDRGEVDVPEMVRWRNELVTCTYGPLIAFYSVNGTDYLHLINPRRRLRSDVTPEKLVPREPPDIEEKALSQYVPKTYRERTGNIPLDLDLDLDLDLEESKDYAENLPAIPSRVFLTKKGRKLTGQKLDWFEEFWEAFGFKKGKAAAADSWMNIKNLDKDLASAITAAALVEARHRPLLLKAGRTPKWAQGWLTDRRWEDEMPGEPQAGATAKEIQDWAAQRSGEKP